MSASGFDYTNFIYYLRVPIRGLDRSTPSTGWLKPQVMEKRSLPELIEGSRVLLRPHHPELAVLMFQTIDGDRDRLGRFLPWVPHNKTVSDSETYIRETTRKRESFESFDYAIYRATDGTYLGNAGLHSIAWERARCEIGYWIAGPFEGQGYVRDAVDALTRACFKAGFHRVEIRCAPANERSAKVPLSLGFRFEARLEEDSSENGVWRDTLVFAALSSRYGQEPAAEIGPPRPSFIGHWRDLQEPDGWTYPGSGELHSIGSALGKRLGLTKLGIHHELLPPGRRTSWPHAESHEEEFVFVLEGHPDVWIDGYLHRLVPGDAVAFPSGTGIAHSFLNNTDREVRLIVIGERSKPENRVNYPLHPERNSEMGAAFWADSPARELGPHDGQPDRLRGA